jgi:hypothetical protein
MGITPPDPGSTYRTRLRVYQRRGSMILWVGAGLVGLIGLVTSNLSTGAPKVLSAVAVTLIILGGAALAYARISFEWAGTQLSRAIDDGTDQDAKLDDKYVPWPVGAELAWYVGLLLAPAAALIYASAVWWTVAAP